MKKHIRKLFIFLLGMILTILPFLSLSVEAAAVYPYKITLSTDGCDDLAGVRLIIGQEMTIKATLSFIGLSAPDDYFYESVEWSLGSNTIARYNHVDGISFGHTDAVKLTGLSIGNTTLNVKSAGTMQGCSASCTVQVFPNKYTVTFNANGGTGTMPQQILTPSTLYQTLNTNTFTRNNATFAGWATSANGPVVYADKSSIYINPYETQNPDITLYAVWNMSVTGVTLNKTASMLGLGSSETLIATVIPDNAANKAVRWNSSGAVNVDSNGKVTAYTTGAGTVIVTTLDGGYQAGCTYTTFTPITNVKLNKNSSSLGVGASEILTATLEPYDANYKSISWISNNTNIVTVDANGKVTAVGIGTTQVVAVAVQFDGSSGAVTAMCSYTVTQSQLVTGITLNKTSNTLIVGDTDQLVATVSPSNAANKTIIWTSDNPNIVSVDSAGKVTALTAASGSWGISAKAADGSGCAARCYYTVLQQAPPATGVALNKSSSSLKAGASETLTPILTPSYGTYYELRWLSNNTSILTVDSNGKVTAVGAGTTQVVLLMFPTASAAPLTSICSYTVTP